MDIHSRCYQRRVTRIARLSRPGCTGPSRSATRGATATLGWRCRAGAAPRQRQRCTPGGRRPAPFFCATRRRMRKGTTASAAIRIARGCARAGGKAGDVTRDRVCGCACVCACACVCVCGFTHQTPQARTPGARGGCICWGGGAPRARMALL